MLYLVGTPIGNRGDISLRAKEVLESVDIVACEDTRNTGLLLHSYGITNKLMSYHEHNKASRGPKLIEILRDGADVALVSDAGMPSINDPGEDLVRLAIEADIPVTAVPGPVAAITALVLSGLDTTAFHYEGFLPAQSGPRRKRIEELKKYNETIIIYEAPHRLMKLIDGLIEAGFGECRAAFCRELTKKYEQVLRMTVSEAAVYFETTEPRGEFAICLDASGVHEENEEEMDIDSYIRQRVSEGISTKNIAREVAEATCRNKKEIYDYIVNLIK